MISGIESSTSGQFIPREQLKVRAAEYSLQSPSGTASPLQEHDLILYPRLKQDGMGYNGPTSARAWCFQEELLSVRRLYFNKEAFNWECLCNNHSELGIQSPGHVRETGVTEASMQKKALLEDFRSPDEWCASARY